MCAFKSRALFVIIAIDQVFNCPIALKMISIIIPTFNEENHIAATIHYLRQCRNQELLTEIIIVDGGSTDQTVKEAEKAGAGRVIVSAKKGRAVQMNFGASHAKGDIFYFLHADTLPPVGFSSDIAKAVKSGFQAGCFRLSFDHKHWFLKANCWFTRFDVDAFRFGDSSLFVSRELFIRAGGFSEKHLLLEDQEIIWRLKRFCHFVIIQKPVITSARKYLQTGIYKTQGIYFLIYLMYRLGVKQQKLGSTYEKLVKQD